MLVRACGIVLGGRKVVYTAYHDITERKAAEAALAAREAEFRAIFETSAAGITEVDLRTGRYLRVNRRFCEIVGRDEAELTGGLGPATSTTRRRAPCRPAPPPPAPPRTAASRASAASCGRTAPPCGCAAAPPWSGATPKGGPPAPPTSCTTSPPRSRPTSCNPC